MRISDWSSDVCSSDLALVATRLTELVDRPVDELSGGQRQRVWIALTLAQGTPLMLLDEPTTFLALAHQVEVLDLLAELNESEDRPNVTVLPDPNPACRSAAPRNPLRPRCLPPAPPPSPRAPRGCCSTRRPRSSISPTRWRFSTCWPSSTSQRTARS